MKWFLRCRKLMHLNENIGQHQITRLRYYCSEHINFKPAFWNKKTNLKFNLSFRGCEITWIPAKRLAANETKQVNSRKVKFMFIHSTSMKILNVVLPSELLAMHEYRPASRRLAVLNVNRAPATLLVINSVSSPGSSLWRSVVSLWRSVVSAWAASAVVLYQRYVTLDGLATAVRFTLTGCCCSTDTVCIDFNTANTGLSTMQHTSPNSSL